MIPNIIIPVEPLEPFISGFDPQFRALGSGDEDGTNDVSERRGRELGLTRVVEGGEERRLGAEEGHEGV